AHAAGVGAEGGDEASGGPFSWISITDSHGVQVWMYGLNLDEGGVTHMSRLVWAALTQLLWAPYQALVNVALWFVDWTMGLSWLHVVASPLLTVGDALEDLVARLGATTVLLTITAIVAVLAMARGRWASGIYEIAITTVIAALTTGVVAHPVAMAGGDGGLTEQAHHAGVDQAAALP